MKIHRVAAVWITLACALVLAGCFGLGSSVGQVGSLAVDSNPPGASIYLDGEDTGETTPYVFSGLEVGQYEVRLVKDGYPHQTHPVHIDKQEQATLSADLIGKNGWITGRVLPERGANLGVPHAIVSTPHSQAVADEDGYFTIYAPQGTYDVIATKEGRAIGKTQNVTVFENQESPYVFIHVWELFDHDQSPEEITIKVTGLEPDDVVVGKRDITIDVDSEYPIYRLRIRVGHHDRMAEYDGYDVSHIVFSLDPDEWSYGAEYLFIVAHDFQNNEAQLIIPFTFAPADDGPAFDSSVKPDPKVVSVTTGRPIGVMRADVKQWELAVDGLDFLGSSELFGDVGGLSVPNHVSQYVQLTWEPVDGASGYSVYRSTRADGAYVKVADIRHAAARLSDGRFFYQEFDSSLVAGKAYYYKIQAYDRTQQLGAMSDPVKAILIEPFSVTLKSPANGAVMTSETVVLSWDKSDIHVPADVQSISFDYYLNLSGLTIPLGINDLKITDQQQIEITGLYPGYEYEWDISPARATAVVADNSISVALSDTDKSVNGQFVFRLTADQ